MCLARRKHTEASAQRESPDESQRILSKSSDQVLWRRGSAREEKEEKKKLDWVLGVTVKSLYVYREYILGLNLTKDHVPREQYTMQMKLLHMVNQRSTHNHIYAELSLIFMLNLQSRVTALCVPFVMRENRMWTRDGKGGKRQTLNAENKRKPANLVFCSSWLAFSSDWRKQLAVWPLSEPACIPPTLGHHAESSPCLFPMSSHCLLSVNPPTLVHPRVTANISNCFKKNWPRDRMGKLIAPKSLQD